MRSELKYLGLGFAISILAAILILSGIVFAKTLTDQANLQPTSTIMILPSPIPFTQTLTSTPTTIPTQTSTPLPSITPTLDPLESLIRDGTIQIVGPLGRAEQYALYRASFKYDAPTRADALRITREINQSKNGYPDNTCGPLAIAILRDANLLGQEINPHDYWLLNPWVAEDRRKLEKYTFPTGRYKHVRFTASIKHFDWATFPLYPGDFVYLHAGSGGNFEHMLTVTRVDAANRVYSMTNHNTQDGFIISEELLYDPADASTGLFAEWTQKQFAVLGSTGFGGFEVWRINR